MLLGGVGGGYLARCGRVIPLPSLKMLENVRVYGVENYTLFLLIMLYQVLGISRKKKKAVAKVNNF